MELPGISAVEVLVWLERTFPRVSVGHCVYSDAFRMLVAVVGLLALSPGTAAIYEAACPFWHRCGRVAYLVKMVVVLRHRCFSVGPVHPALRHYGLVEHWVDACRYFLPDFYLIFCKLK